MVQLLFSTLKSIEFISLLLKILDHPKLMVSFLVILTICIPQQLFKLENIMLVAHILDCKNFALTSLMVQLNFLLLVLTLQMELQQMAQSLVLILLMLQIYSGNEIILVIMALVLKLHQQQVCVLLLTRLIF